MSVHVTNPKMLEMWYKIVYRGSTKIEDLGEKQKKRYIIFGRSSELDPFLDTETFTLKLRLSFVMHTGILLSGH